MIFFIGNSPARSVSGTGQAQNVSPVSLPRSSDSVRSVANLDARISNLMVRQPSDSPPEEGQIQSGDDEEELLAEEPME